MPKERGLFDPPTFFERIISHPLTFLVTYLYSALCSLNATPRPQSPQIKIICISDTHTFQADIPDGDLLIHAGDLTDAGTPSDIQTQLDWLHSLPHEHKIVIAGNHDTYLDPASRITLSEKSLEHDLNWHDLIYLQHSSTTLRFPSHANRHLRIYGAPQIPKCGGSNFAFQYPRGRDAWSDTIPNDTEILVTHCPPKYHCDLDVALGCEWLLKEIWRVKPRLHVCGHVHAGAGREVLWWDEAQRAYEKLRERGRGKGLLWSIPDPRFWIEAWMLLFAGGREVLWTRVWGGNRKATTLVNAALMDERTKTLKNAPQIVYL